RRWRPGRQSWRRRRWWRLWWRRRWWPGRTPGSTLVVGYNEKSGKDQVTATWSFFLSSAPRPDDPLRRRNPQVSFRAILKGKRCYETLRQVRDPGGRHYWHARLACRRRHQRDQDLLQGNQRGQCDGQGGSGKRPPSSRRRCREELHRSR